MWAAPSALNDIEKVLTHFFNSYTEAQLARRRAHPISDLGSAITSAVLILDAMFDELLDGLPDEQSTGKWAGPALVIALQSGHYAEILYNLPTAENAENQPVIETVLGAANIILREPIFRKFISFPEETDLVTPFPRLCKMQATRQISTLANATFECINDLLVFYNDILSEPANQYLLPKESGCEVATAALVLAVRTALNDLGDCFEKWGFSNSSGLLRQIITQMREVQPEYVPDYDYTIITLALTEINYWDHVAKGPRQPSFNHGLQNFVRPGYESYTWNEISLA